jgi:hypothetical protein
MTRWKLTAVAVGFAGLVGVALADPPENPFEGSWDGTYLILTNGQVGTVEFTISRTGALQGTSINEIVGVPADLVGIIDAGGWMRGVAIANRPLSGAQFFSGTCSIDEDGNMICELSNCFQNSCIDFVVTVAPVVGADEESDDVEEADPDSEELTEVGVARSQSGACAEGGYEGHTSGAGWIGGDQSRQYAKRVAVANAISSAEYSCAAHCGVLDAFCPGSSPDCRGTARINGLKCHVYPPVYDIGERWVCSGEYKCTCTCAENP